MKWIFLALGTIACTIESGSDHSSSVGSTTTAANAHGVVASPNSETAEDSVLNSLLPSQRVVLASGDTVASLGGGMLDESYGASLYEKNGKQYVRIQRSLGHRSDGWPIWSTRTRLPLPPMRRKQALLFAGMCGVGDKVDPYLMAVPAPSDGDSTYRNIQYAWRFDSSNETIHEISTAHVVCRDVNED